MRELTERFDGVRSEHTLVPAGEVEAAVAGLPRELVEALGEARDAVREFHEAQLRPDHEFRRRGITVRGRTVPVDRAGCYVPGGRGAYPSSVLMTAVPARVAGVGEVVLCVPPDRSTGRVAPATLAAAALAGVDEVHAVGGAQAVAAMAYGTETIRPVDVIVGPGNAYVALAKREVAGQVGVPMAFAGPSEIVVVADGTGPVDYLAIDLMVQAEHGPDGLAWLVTWEPAVADAVDEALQRLVAEAPRSAEITATFARGGFCALVDGPDEAMAVVNHVAPEHLELVTADPEVLVPAVRHAGAVFLGPLAPRLDRRLRRRAEPRAAHLRHRPLRQRPHRRTTSPSRSTWSRSMPPASGPPPRSWPRWPRPRGSPPTPSRCASASETSAAGDAGR